MTSEAVFILDLLQDLHVLRPLVFMAARDFRWPTSLLISDRFVGRDPSGSWRQELQQLCDASGATFREFADSWDAHQQLLGGGLIFAASESNVPDHAVSHDIFRHTPPGYLKVTVQHGFECVGFRHGEGHGRGKGATASFAADIICTWYPLPQLTSLAPSQAPKVIVTGPTAALQVLPPERPWPDLQGLVCENLHSIRFHAHEKLEEEFLKTFRTFASALPRKRGAIRLRPHPAGQYSLKAGKPLPRNVAVVNAPLYRMDLRQFSYGISPPSSVVIDMLLAGIPTAVWQDAGRRIDVSNFEGLPILASSAEMVDFVKTAQDSRSELLSRQTAWLARQGMPIEGPVVYRQFARLFESVQRRMEDSTAPAEAAAAEHA